jgi:hypothetical protein
VHPGGERRAGDEVADHAGHTEPEQQRTDVALVDPRQLLQCRAHERVGGEVPEHDEHRRDDADAHTRIAGLLTAPVGCPTTMSAWSLRCSTATGRPRPQSPPSWPLNTRSSGT